MGPVVSGGLAIPTPLQVLIVDDRQADAELMLRELRQAGFDPRWHRVETENEFLTHLEYRPDVILADHNLSQFDGLRALELLRKRGVDIPFILVSGSVGEDLAVSAVKGGAADYLLKDRMARLGAAVTHALEERRLRNDEGEIIRLLRVSEKRFRALIENSLDGIMLLAEDGTILYESPAGGRILGYSPSERIGRPSSLLEGRVHPDDRDRLATLFTRLVESPGMSFTSVHRIRHLDGSYRWIEAVWKNLLSEPSVGAIVSNYRDITERKENEEEILRLNADLERRVAERTEELRQAKGFLETLVAMSPSMIFRIRMADNVVTYVSPNIERLLGILPEDAIGIPDFWTSRIHPDDRAPMLALIAGALEQHKPMIDSECRVLHKDGSYRWLYSVIRFDADGPDAPHAFHGYVQDITARKAIEEEVRSARGEAERASQAKSEFLSRMSHELRTPLNAILGFAQLLEMDTLDPGQQESVDHILKGGRHLLELINEVLDISRIESGRMTLSLEPVLLKEILDETASLMRPLAADRKIKVASAPEARWHVMADRNRLRQVLLNLLSNAVKYNREGGLVTVSCESPADGRVRINVRDTGPGIPQEKMARLFVPFDRLGAGHSATEGTGIGLALSKGLVHLMGGEIGVESTVDKGSIFWVSLQLAEDPAMAVQLVPDAPSAVAAATIPQQSRTVLYIEDNLSNLQLLQRILATRPGIKLVEAMQGRLGLDLAREHHPDLILLDLHLPDLSGEEALLRLQAEPETSQIPVVVISADATRDRAARLLASGARAYVTKPLDVREFLGILDDLLGRKR